MFGVFTLFLTAFAAAGVLPAVVLLTVRRTEQLVFGVFSFPFLFFSFGRFSLNRHLVYSPPHLHVDSKWHGTVFGMFSFRFSFHRQECAPLGPRQRDPAYSLVLARQQCS